MPIVVALAYRRSGWVKINASRDGTNIQRRLAAILAADIAGYSALMGSDEEATVRGLKGHFAVILPLIVASGARVIKTTGDGILAEFGSAINAVNCATSIQEAMAERNGAIGADRRMQFRIGVNLGDLIHDETDVYGDGINIAARLEAIADPGGICVSDKVQKEIQGKVDVRLRDLGPQKLKNIAEPVRVYRIDATGAGTTPLQSESALPLPDKPSIAVLPFANLSGDRERDYFADGMTEEIISALSRVGLPAKAAG